MTVSAIPSTGALALEDLLVEFGDLAEQLDMTEAEQAGVTGLPVSVGVLLSQGVGAVSPTVAARCARRLTYCVPLLRQILRNEGRFASMGPTDQTNAHTSSQSVDATSVSSVSRGKAH